MKQQEKANVAVGLGGKFFGQFLLERGTISTEQLLEAANFQKLRNAKLGAIAIAMGLLTEAQVAQIHAEQRRTDKRFGDLALELNLLTSVQLDELLRVQKSRHVLFGEVLVEKGFLSRELLDAELAQFQAESRNDEDALQDLLKTAAKDVPVLEDALDVVAKMFRRLVHEEIKLQGFHQDKTRWHPYDLTARLAFEGEYQGTFVLSMPEGLALRIVERMLGRPFPEVNDLVLDALAEFANIVCGNICSRLSLRGIEADLHPPQVSRTFNLDPNRTAYIMQVATAEHPAEVVLLAAN